MVVEFASQIRYRHLADITHEIGVAVRAEPLQYRDYRYRRDHEKRRVRGFYVEKTRPEQYLSAAGTGKKRFYGRAEKIGEGSVRGRKNKHAQGRQNKPRPVRPNELQKPEIHIHNPLCPL